MGLPHWKAAHLEAHLEAHLVARLCNFCLGEKTIPMTLPDDNAALRSARSVDQNAVGNEHFMR
jgi:hypothetical protein